MDPANFFEAHAESLGQEMADLSRGQDGFPGKPGTVAVTGYDPIPAYVHTLERSLTFADGGASPSADGFVFIRKQDMPKGLFWTTGLPILCQQYLGHPRKCQVTYYEDMFSFWRLIVSDASEGVARP